MHHLSSINHPIHVDLLNTDNHYASMLRRKQELEDKLSEAMNHSAVDWDGVKLIKRKKLAISQQVEEYLRQKGAFH